MINKVHYQPDVPDYCGDGNFEPIACGREEVEELSHLWGEVTCELCLKKMTSCDCSIQGPGEPHDCSRSPGHDGKHRCYCGATWEE